MSLNSKTGSKEETWTPKIRTACRIGFEDRAVRVDLAVDALVGYADLAFEAWAEVCAAGCEAGVGAAVEGIVDVLDVAGPCYG